MGICWSFASNNQTPPATSTTTLGHLTSSSAGISHTTSNITTSTSSALSGKSAASGGTSSSKFSAAEPSSGGDDDMLGEEGRILSHPNLRIFTFAELRAATRNFRSDTVLGEGGFGKVYKGWIEDRGGTTASKSGSGTVIAVKKLNSESFQGYEEWQSEVNFLGCLSHPNLVKLIGYSWDEKELLLVYEFMQKGSLENHLFGRGSAVNPLPWEVRLKILIDAARGLAFLHASENKVIYRDFKASNILLDGSYNAKISDFGLAKFGPSASQSHVTTRVMGTPGYAAPEYVATGHLYVKSDVYGFGVVVVEMLTGLRVIDPNRPNGQQTLVEWIKPHLAEKRKLKDKMDSRLAGRYPSRAAVQIAQLALSCLGSEPKMRPSMKEVVATLEQIESVDERPGPTRKATNNSRNTKSYRHGGSDHRPLRHSPPPLHPPRKDPIRSRT
ncbi:unnamed protein product [Cuscuta epithymum]|uniref:non-specific serine/threonine protein kinase n=1 Tax=Cuscuta epithymum TaxID=186058 RepID=A0AAV0DQA1_9ASTE|nr:unnamed protein product [Cuscuta epithymum]CAH9126006.1 unnamed protein product [Cuscuta epithymum]